jgi:hypothetical protein
MQIATPLCIGCVHYFEGTSECAAFPQGIPADIWFEGVDHLESIEGDRGIIFQPDPQSTFERLNDLAITEAAWSLAFKHLAGKHNQQTHTGGKGKVHELAGAKVLINKGANKGKTGTIVEEDEKWPGYFNIQVEGGPIAQLSAKSVTVTEMPKVLDPPKNMAAIKAGKYKGQSGEVLGESKEWPGYYDVKAPDGSVVVLHGKSLMMTGPQTNAPPAGSVKSPDKFPKATKISSSAEMTDDQKAAAGALFGGTEGGAWAVGKSGTVVAAYGNSKYQYGAPATPENVKHADTLYGVGNWHIGSNGNITPNILKAPNKVPTHDQMTAANQLFGKGKWAVDGNGQIIGAPGSGSFSKASDTQMADAIWGKGNWKMEGSTPVPMTGTGAKIKPSMPTAIPTSPIGKPIPTSPVTASPSGVLGHNQGLGIGKGPPGYDDLLSGDPIKQKVAAQEVLDYWSGKTPKVPSHQDLLASKADHLQNLSEDDITAFVAYRNSSNGINWFLRKGGTDSGYHVANTKGIDKAFQARKGALEVDMMTYRGVSSGHPLADNFSKLKPGTVFHDEAYASTSRSHSIAGGFSGGGVIMRIRSPKGSTAAYIGQMDGKPSVTKKSKIEVIDHHEAELLLPRGAAYVVLGTTIESGTKYVDIGVVYPDIPPPIPGT